jgi:AcrR family transcriptional regulator
MAATSRAGKGSRPAQEKGTPRRVRRDPRREATRAALIEKAEAMFAESGINGVSLRQIGAAVGSANANIIGYYFGEKEALIEAILLKHRLPVEEQRAQLLERARREGRHCELPVLLDVLWRPLLDKKNSDGLHAYAAFLGSITRSKFYALRLALNERFPVTQNIISRMAELLPDLPERYFRARIHVLGDLITGVLQRIDFDHEDDASAELLYADALRVAHAILLAPVSAKLDRRANRKKPASIVFV